jgi:hypothetical protein
MMGMDAYTCGMERSQDTNERYKDTSSAGKTMLLFYLFLTTFLRDV